MEKRVTNNLSLALAFVPFAIGAVAVFGYLLQLEFFIRLVPFFPSLIISPVFILAALAIVAIIRQKEKVVRIAVYSIVFVSVVGIANSILNLGWEMNPLTTQKITPISTYLGVLLLGLAIYLCGGHHKIRTMRGVLVACSVVLVIALRSIHIYLFRDGINLQGPAVDMALGTAVGLICFSFSLFFLSATIKSGHDELINERHPVIVVLRTFSVKSKFLILSVMLITGLTVFAASTFKRFIDSNKAWAEYSDNVVARESKLSRMYELLGYGGGSAYFKNLVLRGSPESIQEAQSSFKEILGIVEDYGKLPEVDKDESLALDEIKQIINKYLFNMDVVLRPKGNGGMTPNNVDATFFIDDTRARAAINTLKTEVHRMVWEKLERVQRSRQLLLVVTIMGFLFSIGIILIFSYLINSTLLESIARVTQTAKDIANENFEGEIWLEGNDEIGHLMKDMATMRERIKESRLTIIKKSEDISRSNLFLNSIFENLPSMAYLKEAGTLKYTHFNRAGEKLVGVQRDQVLGQNDFDILPRIRAEEARKSDQSALASGGLVEIPEETFELRTGGLKILNTKKIPILDSNGVASHVLGISEDVTDRHLLERSLKEHKERLNLVLRDSHIVTWDWNIKTGWISGDESFYDFLGCPRSVHGLTLADLVAAIHPEDRNSIAMEILDGIKQKKDLDLKFQFVRPSDRRVRNFALKGKIYTDFAGRPDLISGIITDFTSKFEGEDIEILSDEKFHSLFAAAPVGVLLIDLRGTIHIANNAFGNMTGYNSHELVALKWNDHLTPKHYETLDSVKKKEVLSHGFASSYEKDFLCKDKSLVPVEVSMSRLDPQGHNVILFVAKR
ncbi:MAG: hypothetical protein A4S09_03540 [Proteobacteria bacterium SG_bin7]|nr:MAG: hypothetical protein A4S09_03540 [Proteobacteria bacterium SG_bin7]